MSNIVIFVDDNDASASVLMELMNATGRSLAEIRSAVENATPVVEREIFDESYDGHAAMLRRVIGSIETLALTHRIYELPEGETMDTCDLVDNYAITIEVLKNILDNADAELDRQVSD